MTRLFKSVWNHLNVSDILCKFMARTHSLELHTDMNIFSKFSDRLLVVVKHDSKCYKFLSVHFSCSPFRYIFIRSVFSINPIGFFTFPQVNKSYIQKSINYRDFNVIKSIRSMLFRTLFISLSLISIFFAILNIFL